MDESVSEQALLGEVDVELSNGKLVHFKPWGIKTGKRMLRRVTSMLTVGAALQVEEGESRVGMIMEKYADDLIRMVADTMGVTVDELENEDEYTLGDFFGLINGIAVANFLSRPGKQTTKNLIALFETFGKITETTEEGSPETPTETSTPTTTDSPTPSNS